MRNYCEICGAHAPFYATSRKQIEGECCIECDTWICIDCSNYSDEECAPRCINCKSRKEVQS